MVTRIYLAIALFVSYCIALDQQDAAKQHEAFLPPVDSSEAERARAIYTDYLRGELTLTAAMGRISEIDFGNGGKTGSDVTNEIASDGTGEKKGEQRQKKIAKPGELYSSTVVALMAEHFYFAGGLVAAQQGTASSSHHQGSSAHAPPKRQQQQSAFVPPRQEKVMLVLSLFRKARELARIGTPTHHFLSVKLFRLLLFLDRCPDALQLAERYVTRAKKLKGMSHRS